VNRTKQVEPTTPGAKEEGRTGTNMEDGNILYMTDARLGAFPVAFCVWQIELYTGRASVPSLRSRLHPAVLSALPH